MSNKESKHTVEKKRVTFSLEAIHAEEVILMGDFNGWNLKKHPMNRNEKGTWSKSVMLTPGKYEYKFMVDGKWVLDVNNNQACTNCFGTRNSIIDIRD